MFDSKKFAAVVVSYIILQKHCYNRSIPLEKNVCHGNKPHRLSSVKSQTAKPVHPYLCLVYYIASFAFPRKSCWEEDA